MGNIVGLMVVKNEADILTRCLDSLHWLDSLVVIDNGSIDGTLDILKTHPRVTKLQVDTVPFNERYFVAKLTELAEPLQADWYVECDADEIFPASFRNAIEGVPSSVNVVTGHVIYMVDDTHYYLIRKNHPRAYRNKQLEFDHLRKLHSGKTAIYPSNRRMFHSGLFIKHYYIRSDTQGLKKHHNYMVLDPHKEYGALYDELPYLASMFATRDFGRLPLKECN